MLLLRGFGLGNPLRTGVLAVQSLPRALLYLQAGRHVAKLPFIQSADRSRALCSARRHFEYLPFLVFASVYHLDLELGDKLTYTQLSSS